VKQLIKCVYDNKQKMSCELRNTGPRYCQSVTRLTASFPGQPGQAGSRKVKPI